MHASVTSAGNWPKTRLPPSRGGSTRGVFHAHGRGTSSERQTDGMVRPASSVLLKGQQRFAAGKRIGTAPQAELVVLQTRTSRRARSTVHHPGRVSRRQHSAPSGHKPAAGAAPVRGRPVSHRRMQRGERSLTPTRTARSSPLGIPGAWSAALCCADRQGSRPSHARRRAGPL